MLLLYELLPFSVINNLGMPSSELQTNFGVLQIDTENSATGGINTKQEWVASNEYLKPKFKN